MPQVLARFRAERKKPARRADLARTATVAHALHRRGNMKESTIDALDVLADQHQEVTQLMEDLAETDDPVDRMELFRELADKLAAHATIEEKLFYPAVLEDDTRAQLLEATEEHLAIKRTLADMLALDVDDEYFAAKLVVLRDEVIHHAYDEEEDKLFPIVREMLSTDELEALGGELLSMFEELLEREPRQQVPDETLQAAPL
jgi:hemerythrin superfamily protein